MDNLTMLHFCRFCPKHIKEAITYGQAPPIQRICSDEEEGDGHLKILKNALIKMGYDARLINRQFRRATVKKPQPSYFPTAERQHHVLHSLRHVIDNDEHLAKIIPTSPLLTFKQLPSLKQTIVRSKLPSLQDSIYHNTTQPCHGKLCKSHQIINLNTTITRVNTTYYVHGRYSCDSANVVYLMLQAKMPKAWYI
eukprot:g43373.t1